MLNTWIEFRDTIVKRTLGCLARYGVVSIAVMASAVGIAAICTWPARPRLSASTSCRIARGSATMRRAHPFALGREAPEPRSALHPQHPERVLKFLDAGRQCGLADVARLG